MKPDRKKCVHREGGFCNITETRCYNSMMNYCDDLIEPKPPPLTLMQIQDVVCISEDVRLIGDVLDVHDQKIPIQRKFLLTLKRLRRL